MKSKNDEITQRILVLMKIDANNLFKRIKNRKVEYLQIFSLRRVRDHFTKIFHNRYESTSLQDLSHCSTELITTLDQFYSQSEEMNWYLFHTQDLPNTIEDYVDRKIRTMEKLLGTLNLYLDAELGIEAGSIEVSENLNMDEIANGVDLEEELADDVVETEN